jgi:hypothetical protein
MTNQFLNRSISTSTLRTQDLMTAFLEAYTALVNENGEELKLAIVNEGASYLNFFAQPNRHEIANQQDMEISASEFVNETLWNELQRFAPEGYYFGNTEGDGSDFGFWENTDDYEFLSHTWEEEAA